LKPPERVKMESHLKPLSRYHREVFLKAWRLQDAAW